MHQAIKMSTRYLLSRYFLFVCSFEIIKTAINALTIASARYGAISKHVTSVNSTPRLLSQS